MNRPPIPAETRRAVYTRAAGRCELCAAKRRRLELHHLTYQRDVGWYYPDLDDCIFGHETPNDLLALCRACHHGQHFDLNGDFWPDPAERWAYWNAYYDELEKP